MLHGFVIGAEFLKLNLLVVCSNLLIEVLEFLVTKDSMNHLKLEKKLEK